MQFRGEFKNLRGGSSETHVFDEQSPSGNDYLAEFVENGKLLLSEFKDVRPVQTRTGIVLGKEGGALAKMVPLFMMFAGRPLGSGKSKVFSRIHVDDMVRLIYEALSNPSCRGIINCTAPNPVRLSEMCGVLGSVLGRSSWLPVPDIELKAVLGEGACVEELLRSWSKFELKK